MAETKTLAGIHDEIQSIVSDKLQVVSYKWLSRNFSVSSNAAKSLLLEFVDKYGNGLEVIYSVSGWLKNNPSTYHVRLVSNHQLSDVKQEFDGNCSIQVYSVQAGLPKDPATLWNHEFVQAEDLFTQPQTIDNCLRNNRFCGVSSSFITRNAAGIPLSSTSSEAKTTGVTELSKSGNTRQTSSVPQPQQKKVHLETPDTSAKSPNISTKTEIQVKIEKEKVAQVLPVRKTVQSDKSLSGSGSALASMWGRASVKSNPNISSEQPNASRQNSADAQTSTHEEADYGCSDEEGQEFKIKRGEGGRKRKVIIDDSDDDDDEFQDAVNLASPDPPKKSTCASAEEISLIFKEKENKPKIRKLEEVDLKSDKTSTERVSSMSMSPVLENTTSQANATYDGKKNDIPNAGNTKRKVIKTRIDERGREVTEVVWEGEESDIKPDIVSANVAQNTSVNNASDRIQSNTSVKQPILKKSPAVGNNAPPAKAGKTGSKKGGNKDPKQGSLLSFFKKA